MRFRLKKAQRRKVERLLSCVVPLFYPFLFALSFLPFRALWALAAFLAFLWGILPSRRKGIAKTNLALLYPPEVVQRTLRQAMRNFLVFALETLKFSQATPEELRERTFLRGLDHLEGFRGKGGILLSCHLGNFPLIPFRLSAEGFKVGVIIKYPRNPFVARKIKERGQRWGLEMIDGRSRSQAARRAVEVLRQGGLVLLMLDQNPRSEGVMVPFLGLPTPTYRSPLVLSRRVGVPIIPTFTFSQGPGRHVLEVLEPFYPTGDLKGDLRELNRIIEDYVRRFPEQWWWWHRRWRHLVRYEG